LLVAVIQARTGSSRFPGKVLEDILGRPMLSRQLERIARANIDKVVVATSIERGDDAIEQLVAAEGYPVYRGSLEDVLDRVYTAAGAHGADHVVRVTADCPVVDHRLIDAVVRQHLEDGNDYTSNTLKRTYPDGQDVEVMRMKALELAWSEARIPEQREHVTPYIYEHPERFRLGSVESQQDFSHLRWTVDYAEDLAVIRVMFERLYSECPTFGMEELLDLCHRMPELEAMNERYNPALYPVRQEND